MTAPIDHFSEACFITDNTKVHSDHGPCADIHALTNDAYRPA